MQTGNVFKLFASCLPVRGARRSTICDLQRGGFHLIPNGLYDILTSYKDASLDEIKSAFSNQHDDVIDEYFQFLIDKELGFWCDDPEHFPDLNLNWERPERITNAIIDIGAESTHDFSDLYQQLDDLGCKGLQLRFFTSCSLSEIGDILTFAEYSRLESIELLFPYHSDMTEETLDALCLKHQRVSTVTCYNAPVNSFRQVHETSMTIIFLEEGVDGPSCCGQVHPQYFISNIELFTEAQTFNSCLNRKVSVDQFGEIRNCPSMPTSYGNARDISLHSVVANRDFQELWEVNKDQIDVCKDCEFRYVCTDCRAFIMDDADIYSKPSKCLYDPYTAQWDEPADVVERDRPLSV